MPGQYAAGTTVPVERSMEELRTIMRRYGADGFQSTEVPGSVSILFRLHGRYYSIGQNLPGRDEPEIKYGEAGLRELKAGRTPRWHHERNDAAKDAAIEAEWRRRWRVLVLYLKAQLEAIAAGVVKEPIALMPFLALPDRTSAAEHFVQAVDEAYLTGRMPALLPPPRENHT